MGFDRCRLNLSCVEFKRQVKVAQMFIMIIVALAYLPLLLLLLLLCIFFTYYLPITLPAITHWPGVKTAPIMMYSTMKRHDERAHYWPC